jgi:cytochrome c biogenesis protein CcmG, thiol:disulfide interchange protein DsbE
MWRWLLTCLVLVLGCAPVLPPSAPSDVLNKPLPKIDKRSMTGEKVSFDNPAGQVVVVKFFAKYCEPCKKTLPVAERLHKENADVAFVGIDEDESQEDVHEMIETFGLTFPVIHDLQNVLAGRFRVNELPATFVTDAQGTIIWVGKEGSSEADLEAAIAYAKQPPQ